MLVELQTCSSFNETEFFHRYLQNIDINVHLFHRAVFRGCFWNMLIQTYYHIRKTDSLSSLDILQEKKCQMTSCVTEILWNMLLFTKTLRYNRLHPSHCWSMCYFLYLFCAANGTFISSLQVTLLLQDFFKR